MPDPPILETIGQLRETVSRTGRTAVLNLYSEGSPEQFRPYAELGCVLHLSTDTFETFHNMVVADLLVGAPSTFSWAAGLLSDGIVLAPNADWGLRDRWLARALDGTFDQSQLLALLSSVKQGY
ncbi:MAG: hypothetical protein R3D05_12810 [Dongiaceae bacterium]